MNNELMYDRKCNYWHCAMYDISTLHKLYFAGFFNIDFDKTLQKG